MPEGENKPLVHFYISIIDRAAQDRGGWAGASGELWTRTVETALVPSPGDHLELNPETDELGGLTWEIRGRYMRHDGSWDVELVFVVEDPNEEIEQYLQRAVGRLPRRFQPWRTEQEGCNIREYLRAGGWRIYQGESNAGG